MACASSTARNPIGSICTSSQPPAAALQAVAMMRRSPSNATATAMECSPIHNVFSGATEAAILVSATHRPVGFPGSESSKRAKKAGPRSAPNNVAVGVASATIAPQSRPCVQTRECRRGFAIAIAEQPKPAFRQEQPGPTQRLVPGQADAQSRPGLGHRRQSELILR